MCRPARAQNENKKQREKKQKKNTQTVARTTLDEDEVSAWRRRRIVKNPECGDHAAKQEGKGKKKNPNKKKEQTKIGEISFPFFGI